LIALRALAAVLIGLHCRWSGGCCSCWCYAGDGELRSAAQLTDAVRHLETFDSHPSLRCVDHRHYRTDGSLNTLAVYYH